MSMKPSNLQLSVCPDCGGFGGGHADTCPLKGKDLLWVIANLRADLNTAFAESWKARARVTELTAENATLREAIKSHAEVAAKMVNAEPVAWMHPISNAVIRASQRIDGVTLTDFDIPLYTSPRIPEGWVMVPKEPTPAMLNAWHTKARLRPMPEEPYKAMIAAAPKP